MLFANDWRPTMAMSDADLDDLPMSAAFVYRAIQWCEDPVRFADIQDQTALPDTTIEHALTVLDDHGLVKRRPDYQDARRTVYDLP